MNKAEVITMIDHHKNKLTNPVEMLRWTCARVIIDNLSEDAWNRAVVEAIKTLEQ
jgi:hypothetical protein